MWFPCTSMYCTHLASCDIRTLCMSILESTARPSKSLLQLHTQHLLLLQLIVMCCNHAFFVFPHQILFMNFVYGFCVGNACAAVEEYWRHFPNWSHLSKGVFSCVHWKMHETSCLPSVCVCAVWLNIWENILEMVERSPKLSTLRLASHIGVSCMQVWKTLHGEDLHPYHNQSVQHLELKTWLSVWICATT